MGPVSPVEPAEPAEIVVCKKEVCVEPLKYIVTSKLPPPPETLATYNL